MALSIWGFIGTRHCINSIDTKSLLLPFLASVALSRWEVWAGKLSRIIFHYTSLERECGGGKGGRSYRSALHLELLHPFLCKPISFSHGNAPQNTARGTQRANLQIKIYPPLWHPPICPAVSLATSCQGGPRWPLPFHVTLSRCWETTTTSITTTEHPKQAFWGLHASLKAEVASKGWSLAGQHILQMFWGLQR